VRKRLETGDVGPGWLFDDTGPGSSSGCYGYGCVIQAEDFTFLLNPNGDSDTWIVQETSEALGGFTLRAPAGDRVDLPAEDHDAIAVYDLEFSQPGTYTAYYRARGFGSSTDSIFTPSDFDTDPDQQQNLTDSGVYDWEVGQTFVIGPSHVGVPLEFRIGKREQYADFDAFVLHLSAGLTDEQLDALFDLLEGDLNGDGFVGITDLNVVLSHWNQNVSAGDLALGDPTGDGFVGIADLNLVLGNWNTGTPPSQGTNIPEPGAAGLLALLGLGLIRRC